MAATSRPTWWRGKSPAIHFFGGLVAELSIFIDESGHFDSSRSGYYVLSLVLHEQRHSIADEVAKLETALAAAGEKTP